MLQPLSARCTLAQPPLVGLQENIYNLHSVSWVFGAIVKAEVDPRNQRLNVTLFGDKVVPIREGRTLNLGPLVSASVRRPPAAARLGIRLQPLADLLRPASDSAAAPVQAPWGQPARPQSVDSVRPPGDHCSVRQP